MSQHLNSQGILECLIEARDSDEQRHARECAACRAETESMAKPLAWFRASFQHVELTSRPVAVPEIWGSYAGQGRRAFDRQRGTLGRPRCSGGYSAGLVPPGKRVTDPFFTRGIWR